MKLIADVKPRGDGTVTASVGSNKYVFKAAEDGRLTADVSDADADVLLDTGNFYPASEDDSAIDAAKVAQLDAAAAALDAAKTAHVANPTDETAAALAAAEEAFDAAAAEPEKPKAKSKSKKK